MKNLKKISAGRLRHNLASGVIALTSLYRKTVSSPGGILYGIGGRGYCKFFPSCSEYTCAAVRQYGLLKGSVLSIGRIIRCRPFSRGGYDPVPAGK